jgi:hypothetical protein
VSYHYLAISGSKNRRELTNLSPLKRHIAAFAMQLICELRNSIHSQSYRASMQQIPQVSLWYWIVMGGGVETFQFIASIALPCQNVRLVSSRTWVEAAGFRGREYWNVVASYFECLGEDDSYFDNVTSKL